MIAVGSSVQHSCPSVFPVSVQARSLISKQGKGGARFNWSNFSAKEI